MSQRTGLQIDHAVYPLILRQKTVEALEFIIKDAEAALKANPDAEKSRSGYYHDEISYAGMELRRRKAEDPKARAAALRQQADALEAEADKAAAEARKAEWNAYNARQRKDEEACRTRCEEEYGMKGHPKADLLWMKAWDRGHSGGYGDIEAVYGDLVDLVK